MACSQHPKSCQHPLHILLAYLLLSFLGRAAWETPKRVLSPRNQASVGASPPPQSLPSNMDSHAELSDKKKGAAPTPLNFADIS